METGQKEYIEISLELETVKFTKKQFTKYKKLKDDPDELFIYLEEETGLDLTNPLTYEYQEDMWIVAPFLDYPYILKIREDK